MKSIFVIINVHFYYILLSGLLVNTNKQKVDVHLLC